MKKTSTYLYPRKYFMEKICGVLATSKRGVPIFNDRHLAYNWHDAEWMVDRARQLGAKHAAQTPLLRTVARRETLRWH